MRNTVGEIMFCFQIIMKKKYIRDLSRKIMIWYIKTHPDLVGKLGIYQRKSRVIIDEMFNKQKNITILPPNYSNYRIVKDKIDFIITCHNRCSI